MSKTCPTCSGSGQVPAHVADALNAQGQASRVESTCHCDGPPHAWTPGWCPMDGPR